MAYVSVEELAEFLRIDDDEDDAILTMAAEAASNAIDDFCSNGGKRRKFSLDSVASTRVYTPEPDLVVGYWVVHTDDIGSTFDLAVTINGDSVSVTWEPANALLQGQPYTMAVFDQGDVPTGARNEVSVTARWGWPGASSDAPTTIKQAALIQASRLVMRRDAPFGIAGSPTQGSELRLLSALDPDVQVLIRPFRRVPEVA